MPIPNLLHPVPVIIEQINKARQEDNSGDGTWFDDDFREPVQQAARSSVVTVQGQPRWGNSQKLGASRMGPESEATGYVVFRYVDLADAGITLQQNDRFTKIGTLDTDVYIISMRPEGHYADVGGPTLVKAFFKDRQPATVQPG